MEFFKILSQGVQFDKNRFLNDAVKLNILKTEAEESCILLKHTSNKETNIRKRIHHHEILDGNRVPDIGVKKVKSVTDVVQGQSQHANNFRRIKGVHIWGADIPNPVANFKNLKGITTTLMENIKEIGYIDPTLIQMYAMSIIIQGRELLASAPTGSGKTAAYLIPIIIDLGQSNRKGIRTLILSPTRVLAKQIYTECLGLTRNTGLSISMIHSKNITEKYSKKAWKADILVTTPNRLVSILKNDWVDLTSVIHLVIDECDNLFEEGFQDQIGYIYSACTSSRLKRYFFSATCAYTVETFCKSHLDNHIVLSVGPKNATVDLVDQRVTFVGTEAGKFLALMDLIRKGFDPPVLLFVQSEERAKELYAELVHNGVNCQAIYAGKPQTQQEKIIESFRMGKIWILISTGLLSRGIDFPSLKMVINYDLLPSPVQYVHNVGRTGRAGRMGQCITFFTEDDRENLQRIAHVLQNSGFEVPHYMLNLKKSRQKEMKVPIRARISRRHFLHKKQKVKKSKTVDHLNK